MMSEAVLARVDAAQSALVIEGVTQRYGQVTALDDVSLTLEQGEFVTLLGPSGCGKTTLLRVLAGFLRPSEGRVLLRGQDVTHLPPHRRPFNLVFQRPTLFPHLDVFENIAFGLRVARTPKKEVVARVEAALSLVRLSGFGQRRAHELSGGQMQRAALARAIVMNPEVLLLDEPLSALDLKIRLEMEVELRRIHREAGATFVYVTHDQREALAISDRVVVFDHGHIEQVGTPEEVYRNPSTRFVATFVGDTSVFPVEIVRVENQRALLRLADLTLDVPVRQHSLVGPAWLVLRSEAVSIGDPVPAGHCAIPGIILDQAFRGTGHTYRLGLEGLSEELKVEVPASAKEILSVGDRQTAHWDPQTCLLLPRDTR